MFNTPRRMSGAMLRGLGADPMSAMDLGSNGQPIVAEDFFTYEVDIAGLVNGTTAPAAILIDAQSDFLWQKACFLADIAAAIQTDSSRVVPLCSILITDGTSQRQLMQSAMPIPSLFGTGNLPFILPVPRVFTAQSQVQLSVANFSVGTTYNLRLSFIGLKRFLRGAARL